MRYTFVIALICVFVLGLVVGWHLGNDTRAPAQIVYDLSDTSSALTYYIASDMTRVVQLSAGKDEFSRRLILQDEGTIQDRASRATELVEAFASTHGASLRMRASVIDLLHLAGQFDQALAWIKEADILASDLEEDELVGQLLDSVTESYASELLFLERFDVLDELYEEITYVMPERVRYFFKLGMLRIQMGNYEGAMMPLSQIQNSHGFIGDQARDLIAQVEANNVQMEHDLEEIALTKTGNQFVIGAFLDRGQEVRLLIDTGAAMTVIDSDVIEDIGYNLNGKPRELFSTANGVIEVPVITLDELSLGYASISAIAVGALPLEMPSGVNGLLGMNFLRHYDFRIDQSRAVLQIRRR